MFGKVVGASYVFQIVWLSIDMANNRKNIYIIIITTTEKNNFTTE